MAQTVAPRSIIEKVLRKVALWIIAISPENTPGDRLSIFLTFLIEHKRFPTCKPLFNDVLYQIRTSDEIIDPLRVFVSDKEFVKLYVKAVVGDEFNVPTFCVLRNMEEVRQYVFPDRCCIKPTHASGRVILRRAGEPINFAEIEEWFSMNHYHSGRETNYKSLKAKVIVEPIIFGAERLPDYKIFCFKGQPKLIQVDIDRHTDHTRKFFDPEWNEQDFSILYDRNAGAFEKPKNLDKMLTIAADLSARFSFVRVDLYSDGTSILVGEITNCHEAGVAGFRPPSAELQASKMIFGA